MSNELPYKGRLLSLDAYRGITMVFMVSAGFGLSSLADNPAWRWLASQVEHVAWEGFTAWDLIQPSFIFIVGVAMPFAFAVRRARGQAYGEMLKHVFKRSLTLLLVGMAIVCIHRNAMQICLTTVLQQIAIAYFFAFFVLGRGLKVQLSAALGILVLHWALFQFWPGVGPEGAWAKNANFGSALDYWWLGRFDKGGYLSINALSSISTVIFGVMAGELLIRGKSEIGKVWWLFLAGIVFLIVGAALHPLIPVVKRIWTPSWTIFSAGWALIFLAICHWVIEVGNKRKWCFIFKVVGMNSITIYVFCQMMRGSINSWLHVFTRGFLVPLGDIGVIIQSLLVLTVHWYLVYWLYKREIFLKVG
jgi:heparan-alpha-glucosaminide N-acetyltransferase